MKQQDNMENSNMNPVFSLKNFRSFGEEGADFELAPITVLTGCNSAGKSSLVKALMLLDKSSKKCSEIICNKLPDLTLKVSSSELRLGGYNNAVHAGDMEKRIVFSFFVWSSLMQEKVKCTLTYMPKKEVLNDGKILSIEIEKADGTIFYQALPTIDVIPDSTGIIEFEHYQESVDLTLGELDSYYTKFLAVFEYRKAILDGEEAKRIQPLLEQYVQKRNLEKEPPRMSKMKNALSIIENELHTKKLKESGISSDVANSYDVKTIEKWSQFVASAKIPDIDLNSLSEEERKFWLPDDEEKQRKFSSMVIDEIFESWYPEISYVDSSSNKISRLYDVDDRDKFSSLLCQLVSKSVKSEYTTGDFVNKWLKCFGIGDSIAIVGTEDGVGVKVYVERAGERRLLADEGYGITQIVSLLLQIDVLRRKKANLRFDKDFNEVIYYDKTAIAVEEPEVHLHPKYQSLLADMFVEAYQQYNIRFIIETHSEYLIRKLQVLVADKESTLTSNDVSLNYVEKDEEGVSHNKQIKIQDDGRLSEPFGTGFYDEADSLAMELFKYKSRRK